jgi:hypothetical protein
MGLRMSLHVHNEVVLISIDPENAYNAMRPTSSTTNCGGLSYIGGLNLDLIHRYGQPRRSFGARMPTCKICIIMYHHAI